MVPEKFGRYEVDSEIGEGAMGRVYKAYDPMVDRNVAIKAIKQEILSQDPSGHYLRRFQRESKAAGGLSHPNILTVYDVGENYFVMEYLEGITLLEYLAEKRRLPLSDVTAIISPLVDALAYAHRKGVFHRDIKPANVMIEADGTPKLMDFGLAHLESTIMTSSGQFLGSPSYMSPEQIRGDPMSAEADLFSLAVVTYELLTGQKPFPGENITTVVYRVMHEDPIPPRQHARDLPTEYDDIFRRALAKNPKERFSSFSEFLTALNMKQFDQVLTPALDAKPEVPVAPDETEIPELEETVALYEAPTEHDGPPAASVASGTERKARAQKLPRRRLLAAAAVLVLLAGGLWIQRSFFGSPPAPPTNVMVRANPAGAEVWLDGKMRGYAPVELVGLSPGNHVVRVSKDGYELAEKTFMVEGGKSIADLTFPLVATSGFLSIKADPPIAAVVIDGEQVGVTPIEDFVLHPGSHEIRVRKRGHKDWSMAVEAEVGETLTYVARLSPTTVTSDTSVRSTEPVGSEPTTPLEPVVHDIGPGITPPRKISGDTPTYPANAKRLGQEGSVLVQMIVTEDGVALDLEIVESAGEILDKAVIKAIETWTFEPAQKNGAPIRVRWRVRQSFRIGR